MVEKARYVWAVETVERLVLAALPERLSETFLAGAVNFDLDELIRAFVIVRDVNLQAGLRNLRLDELKRRLEADAGLQPRIAARQCGFGSFNIAQRLFMARFGCLLSEMNTAPRPARGRGKPRRKSADFD